MKHIDRLVQKYFNLITSFEFMYEYIVVLNI